MCAAVLCGGTQAAHSQCVGDCNGSGKVTVNEFITMVNIALGTSAVAVCRAGDADSSGTLLHKLNTPPCFAGYCDWRLPTSGGSADIGASSGQAAELESILAAQCSLLYE